jgi:hypothetical protein
MESDRFSCTGRAIRAVGRRDSPHGHESWPAAAASPARIQVNDRSRPRPAFRGQTNADRTRRMAPRRRSQGTRALSGAGRQRR